MRIETIGSLSMAEGRGADGSASGVIVQLQTAEARFGAGGVESQAESPPRAGAEGAGAAPPAAAGGGGVAGGRGGGRPPRAARGAGGAPTTCSLTGRRR